MKLIFYLYNWCNLEQTLIKNAVIILKSTKKDRKRKKRKRKSRRKKGRKRKGEESEGRGWEGGRERLLVLHNLITMNTSQRTKRLLNYFETIYFRTYVYEGSSD